MSVLLTADICAHGIIAAARCLGFDPIHCATVQRGISKGAVVAAAAAASELTGLSLARVTVIFGLGHATLGRAISQNTKAFNRAQAAASQAMVAAGVDLSGAADAAPVRRTRPVPARRTGTVVAPPPAASEEPASPPPPAPRADHTNAILEALARRRERIAAVPFEVVGVAADKALIGATEPGGCVWPMGDPREPGYRSCQAAPLSGRLYCAEHLKKAGMKPVAKVIQTVGRVAESYVDREAG